MSSTQQQHTSRQQRFSGCGNLCAWRARTEDVETSCSSGQSIDNFSLSLAVKDRPGVQDSTSEQLVTRTQSNTSYLSDSELSRRFPKKKRHRCLVEPSFFESFQHTAFDMFCEDVRLVVVRRKFLQDDVFVSGQLLDEQEAHGHVFRARWHGRTLANHFNPHQAKNTHEQALCSSRTQAVVLSFCRAAHNCLLNSGPQTNRAARKPDPASRGGASRFHASSPVLLKTRFIPQHETSCSQKVPNCSLQCIQVSHQSLWTALDTVLYVPAFRTKPEKHSNR